MLVRRTLALVAAGGAALAVTVGGSIAVAQQDAVPELAGDDALLERLDAIEADLPTDVAPSAVSPAGDGATWGTISGDVTGAAAVLATLEPDLLRLYVDADDTAGPVGAAVADVARGWLDLGEGYDLLAAWESHDLAFPLGAADDEGTATGADELRGAAEQGLRLVLGAQQRHLAGYVALRDLGLAAPAIQTRVDGRAVDAEAFDREVRPAVLDLLSLPSTQVVVPVERFETSAPGVDARARSMTVTCVDRDLLAAASGAPDAPDTVDPFPATAQDVTVDVDGGAPGTATTDPAACPAAGVDGN